MDYCFSEDLGKQGDYHGRVLSEIQSTIRSRNKWARSGKYDSEQEEIIYPEILVRWIGRSQITYPELVNDSKKRLQDPRIMHNAYHLIDATGVGLPVLEYMRYEGLSPIGIWITGGAASHESDYGYNVPKMELITALQTALQRGVLKFAQGLDTNAVEQLKHEFKTFKEKRKTATASTFEAWRDKDHDDILLSLAINVWWIFKVHGVQMIRPNRRSLKKQKDYNPLTYGL